MLTKFINWTKSETSSVLYYLLLAAQGIAGSSFALIYQCGFETCFGKVGAGMTGGILWMAGNFASTVFVVSILKLSEQVESDLTVSTCLKMVQCQEKEWDLKNGVA